jgi:hypothetical protein
MAKTKMDEQKFDRISRALDRQLKGIITTARIAEDATYGENYNEILIWLQNVESCLTEAKALACELRDATK